MNQQNYYNRFLPGAINFAEEINKQIKQKNISLQDKINEKFIYTDETNNEWQIRKDYNLGILEMSVLCKIIVNNRPIYKSAWVYDICTNFHTNYHYIKNDNLYFHINRTKSLL